MVRWPEAMPAAAPVALAVALTLAWTLPLGYELEGGGGARLHSAPVAAGVVGFGGLDDHGVRVPPPAEAAPDVPRGGGTPARAGRGAGRHAELPVPYTADSGKETLGGSSSGIGAQQVSR